MLDKLVEKALNSGYGEIVASLVAFMVAVITYYVLRHIKRYDKVHDAVFGAEGLHSSVKTIISRLDSHDKEIEQVIETQKALVSDVIKIKGDTAFIRGWIERGEAEKNRRHNDD